MGDVEQALARQTLHGGDLVTTLLEVAPVSEARLTDILGQVYGLAAASHGELPRSADRVLGLVPGDLSTRQGVYPLEEREGCLTLAVSEPLPAEVEEDLGFALGVRVEQRVAPLVRIRQAVARDYGVPLERRMQRLVAKLEGRPDPSPSSRPAPSPAALEAVQIPRPGSLPPLPTAMDGVSAAPQVQPWSPSAPHLPIVPSADQVPTPSQPPIASQPAFPSQPPSLRLPPRRGPYLASAAERDLASAKSRDAVVRVFFDFASQYFEYSALFAVHGEIAEGRDARGPGTDRSRIVSIGVPLDLPSTLRSVRDAGQWKIVKLADTGLDQGLLGDLARPAEHRVLLLPIVVRKRCVIMLYGDHGDADVDPALVGEVIDFAPLVSRSLERIIVDRKRAVLQELSRPESVRDLPLPTPGRPRRSQRPAARERAAALAHALAPPPTPRFDPDPRAPASSTDETPLVPPATLEAVLAASRDAASSNETPAFPLTRRSTPPVITTHEVDEPPEEGWEATVPESTPDHGPAVSVEVSESSDGPDLSFVTEEIDGAWAESEAEESPPQSRVISYSARTPQKPRDGDREMALPSVIVDVASDCRVLVDKLVQGNAEAETQLAEMGDLALDALFARFPGPLTESDSGATAASRSGPVLRAVVRFGPTAIPRLVKRAGEAAGIGRTWAIRLLGEIPGAESARALVPHLLDDDAAIREAALSAGRLLQADEDSRRTLGQRLGELAGETVQSPDLRRRAVRALAGLRDAQSVPALLKLLEQSDSSIAHEATLALVAVTLQDHGSDVRAWREWWKRSQSRHRVEWMIEALNHDGVDIRRAAGQELKSLTKEYFGYYEDLPRKERVRAQKLYQQWWETKGRPRSG